MNLASLHPVLPVLLLVLGACSAEDPPASPEAREPYPGEDYQSLVDRFAELALKPEFESELTTLLANPPGGTGPDSYGWRIEKYRTLLSLRLFPERPWPADLDFTVASQALIDPVPIDHPELLDAYLDFAYLVTDEAWDLKAETNAQILSHAEYWEGRFPKDHPYALSVLDLKAGLYATFYEKDKAIELLTWIHEHIDIEAEAERSPIFVNGFLMTRSHVMRWFGQDVEARRLIEQALELLERYPVDTPFGRQLGWFSNERYLDILWALEQTQKGLQQTEAILAENEGQLTLDYYLSFRDSQAHFLLDEILIRQLQGLQTQAREAELTAILAEIDQILSDPEQRELLQEQFRVDELDLDFQFGQNRYALEWWRQGPEQALARMHQDRAVEWLESDRAQGNVWYRRSAHICGDWAILTAEANAPIEEQKRALALVRPAIHRLVESLQALPPFTDGYDPNHRSGLRNLVEALIVHALKGDTESVSPEEAVAFILEQGTVGSVAKLMQAPGGTLDEVQARLCPPGTGVLHFQPGFRNHYWVLIDAEGVSFHEIGRPYEYRHKQSRLFASSQLAQITAKEQRLHADLAAFSEFVFDDGLIAHIRERGWSTILTSGVAGHYYVPFDLLPTDRGEPIGAEFRISHLPSLTVGLEMHRRSEAFDEQAAPTFLSVIAPDVAIPRDGQNLLLGISNVLSLAFRAEDAQALYAGIHPDWNSRALTGPEQATLERVTQALADGVHLFHILGHGHNAKDLMRTPGILLHSAGDQSALLTHKRLQDHQAPWLCLLTACSTTDVEPRSGDDGGHHLAGSFLARGSNTVLCSALPVEYHASQRLDAAILAELAEGKSAAEALFQARQKLGGADGPASLYLVHAYGLGNGHMPTGVAGQGQSIVWPSEPSTWPRWIVIGFGLAAIALGWIYRRRTSRRAAA